MTLGDTKLAFMRYPNYKENDFFEQGAEIVVYLPPKVPIYRGIFFADGWGTMKRYSPLCGRGLAVHFNSIRRPLAAACWTERRADRVGGGGSGPQYLPKLMKAIAEYTGHPEIEHAPVVMTPRQAAWKNIATHYYQHEPHKVIAIGYGFADAGRSTKLKN